MLSAEGQMLSTGSLVTELWGDDPPDRVENALQAHVSRLRRKLQAIEPDFAETRLIAQAGGYRLTLAGAKIDAMVFTRALAQARLTAETDPTETAYRLREALALWQGPAFGGAAIGLAAQAAAVRLDECRLAALQLLFDSELRVGLHTAIIPELTELVRAESPNERLCEQLMVALYRCGRQTDALGVYRWMRNRMLEELGIEPSPVLRNHERAILAHHPDLQARQDHLALRDSPL
ncbi:AfsR/SARP family transcriptional regulator [Micromonospora sp. SH-82]|uniref:AfsR/SARP family transcriptional regulator n=1 Tax=Micromonospora sp. SH-82 TaxID=3132938 RepID=UPI003EBF4EC7